jgi:hypothetical protein
MNRQDKPRIDPRALIARLNKEGNELLRREIIAPLLPHGKIRTRLNGMIHEFRPREKFVGWGRFRLLNEREAELLGEAQPWERGGYLELFPALRMILLWPDPHSELPGTWVALPYNESDARQRFGLGMELYPVFLGDPAYGAERFERVIVRVDGKTLWFDGLDTLADPTHGEWLRDEAAKSEPGESGELLSGLAGSERLALLFWRIRQLEISMESGRHLQADGERSRVETERQRQGALPRRNRQQQREWLRQERVHGQLEARLQYDLAKADAVLHSYSEHHRADGSVDAIVVEWSERGQQYRYRSTIEPDFTVVSSGICLSDRDRDFDLTSLVNVVTDAEWD